MLLIQFFIIVALLCRCEASSATLRLMEAVAADNVDQLKSLIEDQGHDIDAVGEGGQTPLMRACLTGKVEALRYLLAAGADINIGEKDGYICPHGIGYQGRSAAVQVLFDHGGLEILNHKHSDGYYAIHRACWGSTPGHTETVRKLLKLGVPIDLAAENGSTPLDNVRSNEGTRKLLLHWSKKQADKVAQKDEI